MTAAALADIHGNVHVLHAVLADPRFEAADQVVVLGDVVAGTFPPETLELVRTSPRGSFARRRWPKRSDARRVPRTRALSSSDCGRRNMGDPGFEPGTSALSERRSNRLS